MSNVLLLADVFEHFRQNVLDKHGLDCFCFSTYPSLAWSMALKHTQVELDLISDPEIYLTFENSIRGGISTIFNRYARANNPLVEGYDPTKPTIFITYLDANNLYGAAQSEPLPVCDFRLFSPDEISRLSIEKILDDSPTSYVIECDLEYPTYLHKDHSDYPLAPEHLTVSSDMLSFFAQNMLKPGWAPMKKLISNLQNKKTYVIHYRNLQFYEKHGLKVTKIYRIISFTQSRWLKRWINVCIELSQNAKSNFEADLTKLQANATFGKTIEQIRNRQNIRLIANPEKLRKAVSKLLYRLAQFLRIRTDTNSLCLEIETSDLLVP